MNETLIARIGIFVTQFTLRQRVVDVRVGCVDNLLEAAVWGQLHGPNKVPDLAFTSLFVWLCV